MINDNVNAKTFDPPPGYAMIPAWLAWKQPSGNALIVYTHLALFGKFNTGFQVYEECRPSRETLANGGHLREKTGYPGTGLSVATVDRALKELRSLGAAVPHQRWDDDSGAQLPTVWTLQYNQPIPGVSDPSALSGAITSEEGGYHGRGGGAITSEEGGSSPVIDNPEPSTQKVLTQKKDSLSATADASSGPPPAEREISSKKEKTSDPVTEAIERMLTLAEPRRWSRTRCRKEIRTALDDRRGNVALVERAWELCLADRMTTSPARFNAHHTWWDQAELEHRGDATGVAAPARVELPYCGSCESDGYRWRTNGEGRAYRCPECNPHARVPAQSSRSLAAAA